MDLWLGRCLLFLVLLSIAPSAGALEPPGSRRPPGPFFPAAFNEQEFAHYRGKGQASVAGQAFLVTRLNKVLVQPGGVVLLLPLTRQTRQWLEHVVQPASTSCFDSPEQLPACGRRAILDLLADKRVAPYLRVTRTSPTGHFWFMKIPAGRYYVLSAITAGADHGREPKMTGIAWTSIDVEWAERVNNVVVTEQRD
jgi:hypothetical protein